MGGVGGFGGWCLCGMVGGCEEGCQEVRIGAGCEDVRALFLLWERRGGGGGGGGLKRPSARTGARRGE